MEGNGMKAVVYVTSHGTTVDMIEGKLEKEVISIDDDGSMSLVVTVEMGEKETPLPHHI